MKKEEYVEWVPVTKKVPGNDKPVLVTAYRVDEEDGPLVMIGRYSLEEWVVYDNSWTVNMYEVVAWMDGIEPYIDWSKVPVDTKIYVRESIDDMWFKKYFAKYENGKIYAWSSGSTSWSAESEDDIISWKYAKLAKPEKL